MEQSSCEQDFSSVRSSEIGTKKVIPSDTTSFVPLEMIGIVASGSTELSASVILAEGEEKCVRAEDPSQFAHHK